jgi:hypothetical protein
MMNWMLEILLFNVIVYSIIGVNIKKVLDKFFHGERDQRTIEILNDLEEKDKSQLEGGYFCETIYC